MKKFVAVSVLVLVVIAIAVSRHRTHHPHGEVTVYSCGGERLEHYEDAEYERIGNSVVVYDGERTIRYLNCTIEVSE